MATYYFLLQLLLLQLLLLQLPSHGQPALPKRATAPCYDGMLF